MLIQFAIQIIVNTMIKLDSVIYAMFVIVPVKFQIVISIRNKTMN